MKIFRHSQKQYLTQM